MDCYITRHITMPAFFASVMIALSLSLIAFPGCTRSRVDSNEIGTEKTTQQWQALADQIRPGMTKEEVQVLLPLSPGTGEGALPNGDYVWAFWQLDAKHDVEVLFHGKELPLGECGLLRLEIGTTAGTVNLRSFE